MGNQNQLNTLLKTSETKKSHHHHEHFPCLSVACLISHQSARSLWSLWRRIHQSSAQEEHRRACLHQPQVLHTPGCCQAAGLVDTLASEGPFTVFAPTNSAFEKVPADALNALLGDKDALTAVLLRHVVSGSALAAKDIPRGSTAVATAGGEEITVTKDRAVKITSSAGSANVVIFDVRASNGIVHAVDTVF